MRDEADHKADSEAEGVTALPPVVDSVWVTEHLGDDGLLLADVRGPNAHIRGHLPGSIPLVLGSPAPVTDRAVLEELASEVGLRLRRHGVTGKEWLVLTTAATASALLSRTSSPRSPGIRPWR